MMVVPPISRACDVIEGRRLTLPVTLAISDAYADQVIASGCGGPEVKVAWLIVRHLNRSRGYAHLSVDLLERKTGIHRRNLSRAFNGLRSRGLVEIVSGGRGRGGRGLASQFWPTMPAVPKAEVAPAHDPSRPSRPLPEKVKALLDDLHRGEAAATERPRREVEGPRRLGAIMPSLIMPPTPRGK
jgi:hypothetical protein